MNAGNLSTAAPSNLTGAIFARVVFLMLNFASDLRASASKSFNSPASEHIFSIFSVITL